jgi:hypothetical protein
MKFWTRITPAIFLLGLFLLGCDKKPSAIEIASEINLDLILQSNHIDRVDFVSGQRTNSAIGKDAEEIATSLTKTNRIKGLDFEKSQVQFVSFYSGTNLICGAMLTDNGFWQFDNYSFKLRK